MKSNLLNKLMLILMSVAVAIGVGCEDNYIFPNEAPANLEITKPSCYVSGGEEVPLLAAAVDEDGDPLYYRWSASVGSFDPADATGQSVTWIAPETPGQAVITLIVTDEIEESRIQETIEIGGDFPVNAVTNEPLTDAIADSGYVYILNLQPIEIPEGTTFTIMEGVRMVARGANSGFDAAGTLLVHGTEANPVTMGPDECVPVEGSWAGIAYRGAEAAGSISYLQSNSADIGLVVKNGADVTISNSSLINNELHGIEVSDGGTCSVSGCTLWENSNGLYMRNGYLTLERSSMRYNRHYGLDMSAITAAYDPSVTYCNISNNSWPGISISGYVYPAIHYNAIFFNGITGMSYGIYLDSYMGLDSLRAENNFWGAGYDSVEEIQEVIYDAHDLPASISAFVGFIPWLSEMPAEVPNP